MSTSTKSASTKSTSTKSGSKKPRSTSATEGYGTPALNLAMLCGPCSGPAELRVLESGTRLATLAVRVPAGTDGSTGSTGSTGATGWGLEGRVTSVPVTVWDPPAWLDTVAAGDVVIVVGRMRRRFYQRPGGVGSRVDLEAQSIGRARDRRRVDAALRKAYEALEVLS